MAGKEDEEGVKRGRSDYEALEVDGRKQVFEETERRWTFIFNQAQTALADIDAAGATIADLEFQNADILPRGGRSRSEAITEIEAVWLLTVPEEVDGKKLSNDTLRAAWVSTKMEADPNAIAVRQQQAEVEQQLTTQRQVIDSRTAGLALMQASLAHQDAVLRFFSVPKS